MRKGKQKSIDTLMGALAEAESRAFYEEEDNVLNDLDELLNVFLRKGEEPERRQLLKEYDSGLPLTGGSWEPLTWSFLAALTSPTTFPSPPLASTGTWTPSGSRAC
mgnify:CR=1 FL=1